MPKVSDFKAWVEMDGVEIKEFGIEVLDERSVSCFIPSSVGKVSGNQQLSNAIYMLSDLL